MSVPSRDTVQRELLAFANKRVLVLGDLIADRYVLAQPARLSREAPVIIANWEAEKWIPGGAANALQNLHALGVDAVPFGVIGEDAAGRALLKGFEKDGISTEFLEVVSDRATVTKTRFLVGDSDRTKQQVLRIDRAPEGPPPEETRRRLAERLAKEADRADAVLLSDYGYGTICVSALRGGALIPDRIPLTLDARFGLEGLNRCTLATPNLGEVESLIGRRIKSQDELLAVGESVRERLCADALLVTQGNQGMTLFAAGEAPLHLPIFGSGEVTDVTGAGDTVIATATAALAGGAPPALAAALANLAAGITVMKIGAATAEPKELLAAAERLA